jgi:hydroxymethylbilane synthase
LERGILDRLGGGCQVALGVHVVNDDLFFFHESCGIRNLKIANNSEEEVFKIISSWLG